MINQLMQTEIENAERTESYPRPLHPQTENFATERCAGKCNGNEMEQSFFFPCSLFFY